MKIYCKKYIGYKTEENETILGICGIDKVTLFTMSNMGGSGELMGDVLENLKYAVEYSKRFKESYGDFMESLFKIKLVNGETYAVRDIDFEGL
jgi:hypothetical protein